MGKIEIIEIDIKWSYSQKIYGHFGGGLFGKFSNIYLTIIVSL